MSGRNNYKVFLREPSYALAISKQAHTKDNNGVVTWKVMGRAY